MPRTLNLQIYVGYRHMPVFRLMSLLQIYSFRLMLPSDYDFGLMPTSVT